VYLASIFLLMLVLPVASIAIEAQSVTAISAPLVAKWFAFWSVGWRLLPAGVRQILQPDFTAREVFGLKSDEPRVVVRELGYANVAIGLLGVLSHLQPAWVTAAALTGGVFLALAGIGHAMRPSANRTENFAMVSDLFVAVVLLAACARIVLGE
jgi:hypothetical protein